MSEKEVMAWSWHAEYPGGRFVSGHSYGAPVGQAVVEAEIAAWHESHDTKMPKGINYIPQDKGVPKRYIMELAVVEVDENGDRVARVDFIELLTATTDRVALSGLMQDLYKDASQQVESYEEETVSERYPILESLGQEGGE